MDIIPVAISGTVGKQVYATTKPVYLKGFWLSPLSANAYIKIRDGNASGTVKGEASSLANSSQPFYFEEAKGKLFSNGMHVKVLGTNAVAYLIVE